MAVADVCKTYRKAVNEMSKKILKAPRHTRWPKDDFFTALDKMDADARKRAIAWYERGIRRGLDEATDAMLDGRIKLENGKLVCPKPIRVSSNVKLRGKARKKMKFDFDPGQFGFH